MSGVDERCRIVVVCLSFLEYCLLPCVILVWMCVCCCCRDRNECFEEWFCDLGEDGVMNE